MEWVEKTTENERFESVYLAKSFDKYSEGRNNGIIAGGKYMIRKMIFILNMSGL